MLPNKLLYDTSRLSDIPNMASTISNRIAMFNKQHKKLIDSALLFFERFPVLNTDINQGKSNLSLIEKKINLIESYEKEHGKLPLVKGHDSTERLLNQLYREQKESQRMLNDAEQQLLSLRTRQFEFLEQLSDNMLDLLDNEKVFSQFLGTMVLSAPLPDDKVRCQHNERRKPIFITALMIMLFDDIRCRINLKNDYLTSYINEVFSGEYQAFRTRPISELPDDLKMQYREELLKPLTKAAIINTIGSYAPEVDEIFSGNRYRQLSNSERETLLDLTNQKSQEYLVFGIGIPHRAFNSHEEKVEHDNYESKKIKFIQAMIKCKQEPDGELFDLLKIPVVYSSFLLSTKANANYEDIYEAYNLIEHSAYKGQFRQDFAQLFLNIVGKFPIGSGLYFLSKRTRQIEKAIVSSLYPEKFDEPVCKQVTKGQIQSLNQREVIISRQDNMYFEDVRYKSEYDREYFRARYNNQLYWNPNSQWEVQIPAKMFWRKDASFPPEKSSEQ